MTTTNTTAALTKFRIVFRGSKADTRKRAVRVCYATSADAAAGFLAENGDTLAKGLPFKPDFVKVYNPYGYSSK